MRNLKFVIPTTLAIGVFSGGTQAFAQNKWTEQGPGPIFNDSNTVLPGGSLVAGAINAIVTSPSSPDVVFVGTVNGGVWGTSNATAGVPTWIPLTDTQLPQLSVKSLAMSPVDSNTLFAGTGSTSSFVGGPGIGVARSTDGGKTWTVLAGSTFKGRTITSIVPTVPTMLNGRSTIFAATWPDKGGVYRSTDNGVAFTRISGTDTSGLPNAGVTSLIVDPSNANRFYAGVPGVLPRSSGSNAGAQAGVYRSDDGGMRWTKVNFGLLGISKSVRILLTIHNDDTNNIVYADVIAANGTLSGVFRSANQGRSWTSLGVPNPPIYPGGDTEGGQGDVHGAIAADPSNPNVVFISGDAQDIQFDKMGNPIKNANGCTTFNANVFRYTGTTWENVVCDGADGTAPHADSRFMTFDADGNLLQANDGGIARLLLPNNAAMRFWLSAVGNIRSAEFHSIAYDPLSNIIFGGTQDNGTPVQLVPGSITWNQLIGADGGVVAIDANQVSHPGMSIRYSSFQTFGFFNRSTWDASNIMLGLEPVGLAIMAGPGAGKMLLNFDRNISFAQPFALNAVDPARMLIGTGNLYESLNQGDSLTNLGSLGGLRVGCNASGDCSGYGRPIAYGGKRSGVKFPDLFYVGAGNKIFHRVLSGDKPRTLDYPGGIVVTIAMNPNDYKQVYISDIDNRIWGSSNEGKTWINLTANLSPHLTPQVTTIEVFSPDGTVANTTLYAGGFGVFQLADPSTRRGIWTPVIGSDNLGIAPALAMDLHYDYTKKLLLAGTLGRGVWLFGAGTPTATASGKLPSTSSLSIAGAAAKNRPPAPRPVVYPRPAIQ